MNQSEIEIRNFRGSFAWALGIGSAGLILAALSDWFRAPFALLLFSVATLVGLVGLLDRRVKLSLSDAGIRYAGWGPTRIPWHEFAGYRRLLWRRNPYFQLVPRRPSELPQSFSWLGRLNLRGARLVRMPDFAIGVTPLAIAEADLGSHLARYLPEEPQA